jgi:hypothetical protein
LRALNTNPLALKFKVLLGFVVVIVFPDMFDENIPLSNCAILLTLSPENNPVPLTTSFWFGSFVPIPTYPVL